MHVRTTPVLVLSTTLLGSLVGLAAGCTSDETSSSSSSSSSSGSSGAGDDGGGAPSGPDLCALLAKADLETLVGYALAPCTSTRVLDDSTRFVWESPPEAAIADIGSVNVTVEDASTFEESSVLCGANNANCVVLPGVGDKALLDLKYTNVLVQKGKAVYRAQCERPKLLPADEDAVVSAALASVSKTPDTSLRSPADVWRKHAACSLAVAKRVAAKL